MEIRVYLCASVVKIYCVRFFSSSLAEVLFLAAAGLPPNRYEKLKVALRVSSFVDEVLVNLASKIPKLITRVEINGQCSPHNLKIKPAFLFDQQVFGYFQTCCFGRIEMLLYLLLILKACFIPVN